MGNEAGPIHHGHDTIVIGASEGGLEALEVLVRDFPADLPAAVYVGCIWEFAVILLKFSARRARCRW